MDKHRIRFKIVVILVVFASVISFGFFKSRPNPDTGSDIVLKHDKGWLPSFQQNFTQQGVKAKEKTGIGIKVIPSNTTDLYIHQMKANLPTEQAPELFTWWAGFRVKDLVEQNLIGDLTHIWHKHDTEYLTGIKNAFTINTKMYGFPYGIDYWPVWYNKKIFSRLNLKAPANWDEFTTICDTLKNAGITPILSSVQFKWPSFIWFEEMVMGQSPDLFEDLCMGRAKYTDPLVVKAFNLWKTMIRKGYFTKPSANMMSNGGYLWLKGDYAMVLCGTWYYESVLLAHGVDQDDIGVFILPSHNAAAGNNIIFEVAPVFTAQNARNVDSAQKVADWWMGADGNGYFARLHKIYPANLNVDTTYLCAVKNELLCEIKQKQVRVLNRYWEATPVEICNTAVEKFAEFMLNPQSPEAILASIQDVADQYWSKHK